MLHETPRRNPARKAARRGVERHDTAARLGDEWRLQGAGCDPTAAPREYCRVAVQSLTLAVQYRRCAGNVATSLPVRTTRAKGSLHARFGRCYATRLRGPGRSVKSEGTGRATRGSRLTTTTRARGPAMPTRPTTEVFHALIKRYIREQRLNAERLLIGTLCHHNI